MNVIVPWLSQYNTSKFLSQSSFVKKLLAQVKEDPVCAMEGRHVFIGDARYAKLVDGGEKDFRGMRRGIRR